MVCNIDHALGLQFEHHEPSLAKTAQINAQSLILHTWLSSVLTDGTVAAIGIIRTDTPRIKLVAYFWNQGSSRFRRAKIWIGTKKKKRQTTNTHIRKRFFLFFLNTSVVMLEQVCPNQIFCSYSFHLLGCSNQLNIKHSYIPSFTVNTQSFPGRFYTKPKSHPSKTFEENTISQ